MEVKKIMIDSIFKYSEITIKFGALALWAVLFFSCKQEKPSDILSHQEMARAILNVYTTEQKVVTLRLRSDSSKIVFEKLKNKLFERDSLQDSLFRKSLDYYIDRPKELELIYTAVVDSLNLMEQRLNALDTAKTDILKTDSIKSDSLKVNSIKGDSLKADSTKLK
jgi:hypothetical protein